MTAAPAAAQDPIDGRVPADAGDAGWRALKAAEAAQRDRSDAQKRKA
jgi:hypothetical protein